MVSDRGILDYDEIEHNNEDVEQLVLKDKNGKVIGFKQSNYKIFVKDQYLDIPKEVKELQDGCLNDLIDIERSLMANDYANNVDKFRDAIIEAIVPYNNSLETLRINLAEKHTHDCIDDLNALKSKYLSEENEEFDVEAEKLSKKYRINEPNMERYSKMLPKSLQGRDEIIDLYALTSVVGTDRLIPEYLKKLGEEADGLILKYKK